ncbi:MAG: FAD:protein FMN transferase [Lachnospiraceae bacterium]|nr:FAD:protein FMN transferase [Lachnospiraceae bacterium]
MCVRNMQNLLKKILTAALLILVCLSTGCENKEIKSISGIDFYFDTVVNVTVYGTEDRKIIDDFFAECSKYEKIFSTTDENSELFVLNRLSNEKLQKGDLGETKFEVSRELYECIKESLGYSELTEGRYDITIRPVSKLWDFRSGKNKVPKEKDVQEGLNLVDYKNVTLIAEDSKYYVSYTKPGIELELGSSAKGYIGDRLIEFLCSKDISSAIISLGGNVQCLGGKTDGNGNETGFKVAIKDPSNPDSGLFETLEVVDKAVVTSGIYERCFEKDGKQYHHILSAKTGYPVESDLASVTVITESGLKADILSTVCFIEGYEKSKMMLKDDKGIHLKFIYKDGSVKEI